MGDVQVAHRSQCGGESSPPTTPLLKKVSKSWPPPSTTPQGSTYANPVFRLGESRPFLKGLFLLKSEGTGFVNFPFFTQFWQMSSLC